MKKNSKNGQSLKVVNPNAAGIDIGSRVHYVAVPEDRGRCAVESFGCVTAELERMARWLKACGVETVAIVEVSRLHALGMEVAPLQVLAHPFPPSAKIDGVLGLDFFRGKKLHIDFQKGEIDLT